MSSRPRARPGSVCQYHCHLVTGIHAAVVETVGVREGSQRAYFPFFF
jgi:hypothetical protein